MKSEKELIELFNNINSNELDVILTEFYSEVSQSISGERKIIYTNRIEGRNDTLELDFSGKSKKIKSAKFSSHSDIEKIVEKLDKEVLAYVPKYSRTVVITSQHIINEYILFEDKVLLRPIEKPFEGLPISQKTPAILEFYYEGSTNRMIDSARYNRKKQEIVWILNLILNFSIAYIKPKSQTYWGRNLDNPKQDNATDKYEMFNPIFEIDSFESMLSLMASKELTEKQFCQKFGYKAAKKFPDEDFISPDIPKPTLVIPDYFDYILKRYYYQNCDKEKFLRASYWYYQASTDNSVNAPTVIVAFASALECLIDKSSKTCSCCSQEIYSISKKVKDLVGEYNEPFIKQDPEALKIIGLFYEIRSSIVHGLALPMTDVANIRGFDPEINKINHNIALYKLMVKLVVLNYFMERRLDYAITEIKYDKSPNKMQGRFTFNFEKMGFVNNREK